MFAHANGTARVRRMSLVALVLAALALPGAAHAAVPAYHAQGARIHGTTTFTHAPTLTPGQHLDTLENAGAGSSDGTKKYYRIHLDDGDTPYVSATLLPPAGKQPETAQDIGVDVAVGAGTPGGDGCTPDYDDANANVVDGKPDPVTAVVTTGGPVGPQSNDCVGGGYDYVAVTRTGSGFAGTSLQLELSFRIEPFVDTTTLPAASSEQHGLAATAAGQPRPLVPGSSFDDAPELRPGTYRASIEDGATQYLRVRLGWGQRLAYSLRARSQVGSDSSDFGVSIDTELYSPVRAGCQTPTSDSTETSSFGTDDVHVYGSTVAAVEYRNRYSSDSYVQPYAIAGDYYLTISTGYPDTDARQRTVPYLLTLRVAGRTERGPDYTRGATPPAPTISTRRTTTDRTPIWIAGALVLVLGVGLCGFALRR